MPISRSGPATGLSRTTIVPLIGRTSPATMRSSVDFPHPLGPTIDTKLFSASVKETSSTADVVPKDFETFWIAMDILAVSLNTYAAGVLVMACNTGTHDHLPSVT